MCNFDRITTSGRSFKKCAIVCIESDRTVNLVNHLGEKGNYPLHFACRYADEPTILTLLDKKASMAEYNENRNLPINDIRKSTLEAHLDSCLSIYEPEPANRNDEKEIRFDFTTMLPINDTYSDDNVDDVSAGNGKNKSNYHKVRIEESSNKVVGNEMNVPIFLSKSLELKQLITHPIVAMFINLKWQQVSPIYYLNLLFYIILCIFLYGYIFLNYVNEDFESYNDGIKVLSKFIYALSVVCLIVLILRELFQLREFRKYIKNIENYIELILIITMIILILPVLSDNYAAKRQVGSIAILFSALELFLLIGKIPKLSTNIVILRTVSKEFLKLLLWYSILICAFALSFYTLFSGGKQSEGEDTNFFVNPALAVIKTIVMLTGEFDAGNIKFDSIPIVSHLIFLMFVFMISMVLFNLMNGLAVADTQEIKNKSEMHSYISQIEYIAYIEELLQNHQLSNYLQKLCNASYFASNKTHIMSVKLQKGGKFYGSFDGSESKQVLVRQSLVKRAKALIGERKIQREAIIAQNADKNKFEAYDKILQDISKKMELILAKKRTEES